MTHLRLVDPAIYTQASKEFSNWKSDFQIRLKTANSKSDLKEIISDLNMLIKNKNLDQNGRLEMKNFRQRVYDAQKKMYKNPSKINESDISDQFLTELPNSPMKISNSSVRIILRNFCSLIVFAILSFLTAYLLLLQSIPLYEAIGFEEPTLCALGALLMITGFAVLHGITNSKILLLLCIYISSYEVLIISKGTMEHESVLISNSIQKDEELMWLKENSQKSYETYNLLKNQYDDPSSKVFKNSWFKEKYLSPAWNGYSNSHEYYLKKLKDMKSQQTQFNYNGLLKILFRLGLVFLCMVSLHNLISHFKLYNISNKEVLSSLPK